MNKLEARVLIEDTGNYDEEEIDDVVEVYEELAKHIGWEDKRRDRRYVVKFHDIFWYMDDEWERENEDRLNFFFEEFCEQMCEMVEEEATYKNIDTKQLLTYRTCGHYETFNVEMPYIGEDNIVELAEQFYDEYNYQGKECAKNQIELVEILYSLEQNYVEYWFEFLENSEFPQKLLKEMREKYQKDQEKKGK